MVTAEKQASAAHDAAAGEILTPQVAWGWIIGLSLVLVLSYGNSLWNVMGVWDSPEYSHGWMIPIFGIVMLYMRQQPIRAASSRDRWIGVGLIAASVIIRTVAAYNVIFTIDNVSFIPALMGVFVFVGGLPILRWAGSPLLFMLFMFPLPGFVMENVHKPLQTLMTWTSTYALQTMGIDAFREGNTIQLENQPLGVVDQCSGLRMLSVFMALALALAMLSDHRPMWERIALFCSSIPIALAVNSIRITLTGMCYNANMGTEMVDKVAHDMAGWVMMPMAFGFLWLVSKIFANVLIEVDDEKPVAFGLSR